MHLVVLGAFGRNYLSEGSNLRRVLMHLVVLGAFGLLPLGAASLRHFQGLERHRLRKHPAGPASTPPI